MTPRVGILGFQGCIEPHEKILHSIGVESVRVRSKEDLSSVDRLILPGGESTTMLRFLTLHDMTTALAEFAQTQPMWGICAGSILLASEVHNPTQECLKAINISARRNFYGSQLESFTSELTITGLDHPITAQFIRAPRLDLLPASSGQEEAEIIARLDEQPVFFSQGRIWACSFHVELGDDPSLHELFLKL